MYLTVHYYWVKDKFHFVSIFSWLHCSQGQNIHINCFSLFIFMAVWKIFTLIHSLKPTMMNRNLTVHSDVTAINSSNFLSPVYTLFSFFRYLRLYLSVLAAEEFSGYQCMIRIPVNILLLGMLGILKEFTNMSHYSVLTIIKKTFHCTYVKNWANIKFHYKYIV